MLKPFFCFLLLNFLFSGCVRRDFFQETALVHPGKLNPGQDSAEVTIGRHYKRSKFHNFFWGKHYRDVWATPVTLPVFRMQENFSGLEPVSMGGGFQTTSLTLKNPEGRLFVLRSLDKDPYKALPKALQKTFLVNIARDQTSAANPFAPLVLPELSEKAGIFYSSPAFFYVRENDEAFGKHLPRVKGKVMMLEEKFDKKESLIPAFGNAVNLTESDEVLKNRYENNSYRIDQQLFARSRLFDVLIGDWDRHEGQWQWAEMKEPNRTVYRPIPKDRDQTFFRMDDGLFPWILTSRFAIKKFQTFKPDYGYLPGLLYNARFIDARALNEVTREDWLMHANEMKTALTDDVLEQAVSQLPEPVYKLEGQKTLNALKKRRDKLPQAAEKMYLLLAEEVTVAGSDLEEKFVVKRLENGNTQVQVFALDGDTEKPFYQREFRPAETRKIILHGLGGEDVFEISGKVKKAIELHVYGGEGEDELSDTSEVKGGSRKTKVYDTKRGIEMELTKEVKKKLSKSPAIHAFDREGL